eukprot:1006297_1
MGAAEHSKIDDNAEAIKSGYLIKESAYLNKYKKRWCVLKGTTLISYKSNTVTKPTESFDLLEFTVVDEVSASRFNLACTSSTKERQFRAQSRSDMAQWLDCIRKVHQNHSLQMKEDEHIMKKGELNTLEDDDDSKDHLDNDVE